MTRGSGDNGVDILALHDGHSYAIQCKRYAKKVGNKAVQEVFSGAGYYNCQRAIVITNSYFTDQAIDTARKLGVSLWDRDFVNKMMHAAYSNSARAKRAISHSNYQAKTKKEKQKQNPGCSKWTLIIFAILVLFALITGLLDDEEDENAASTTAATTQTAVTTTQSAKTTTQAATTTTQSHNGGAVKGFDSVNSLKMDSVYIQEKQYEVQYAILQHCSRNK